MSDNDRAPEKTAEYWYEYSDVDVRELFHGLNIEAEASGITVPHDASYSEKLRVLGPLLEGEDILVGGNFPDPALGCWVGNRARTKHKFTSTGYACMLCRTEGEKRGWLICECGACGPECEGRLAREDMFNWLTGEGYHEQY